MPRRSDSPGNPNGNFGEVRVLRHKRPARKGTKVSLPFRIQRGARHFVDLTGQEKLPGLRQPTDASSQSRPSPSHDATENDERGNEAERADWSRPAPLDQFNLAISGQLQSTGSLFDRHHERHAMAGQLKHSKILEPYKASPYLLLGSGGDDPFSTLPSDLPKAFLDEHLHTIPKILATMVSRGTSGKEYGNAWATKVMSSMTSNLALFYSMIFAEMLHTRVQSGNPQRSPLEFEIGARAIRFISHDMRNPDRARLDSSIWAVVILGFAGKEAPLRIGSKYPRQSFLKELQDLHIYCKMEVVLEHVLGLIRLVELIGGLQNVKTPGMAQTISFCGIMGACRTIERPIFPFLAHSNHFMVEGRLDIDMQEREWASPVLGPLGSGFWKVWGSSNTSTIRDLCIIIQHVCDFTIVIENHTEGRWSPRTFTTVIDQRNFIQHSVMSLKPARELFEHGATPEEDLYGPCRLAIIVFSFLVVFPVPPVAGPFESLTERLLVALSEIKLCGEPLSSSKLLLWILVMGAVAAIGLPERQWFLRRIHDLLQTLAVEDWKDMKVILQSFLWLPSTNDFDGQEVWAEMHPTSLSMT